MTVATAIQAESVPDAQDTVGRFEREITVEWIEDLGADLGFAVDGSHQQIREGRGRHVRRLEIAQGIARRGAPCIEVASSHRGGQGAVSVSATDLGGCPVVQTLTRDRDASASISEQRGCDGGDR